MTLDAILDTLGYVSNFYGATILIKVGGSILNDDALIHTLCRDLTLLRKVGIKVVVVHGGSKAINEALALNQLDNKFINGLRVTTKEGMRVIEMVLTGHINTMLVRKLNHMRVNATGLTGADSGMLLCDHISEDHGYVGQITQVNVAPIHNVLSLQSMGHGAIPVIAPVGVDENGHAMNINADWAAVEIAHALKVDKLIYLTDQNGIYDKDDNIISEITGAGLQQLIEDGTVSGGMLTKVDTIISALDKNIDNIHIINGKQYGALISELFTVKGIGTLCMKTNQEVMA